MSYTTASAKVRLQTVDFWATATLFGIGQTPSRARGVIKEELDTHGVDSKERC